MGPQPAIVRTGGRRAAPQGDRCHVTKSTLSTQHTLSLALPQRALAALTEERSVWDPGDEDVVEDLDLEIEPVLEGRELVGETLGPFAIEALLGEGSYAKVWQARHEETGLLVAIKLATTSVGERSRAQFAQEVTTLARMRHPNIVHVFDAGTIDRRTSQRTGGLLAEGVPYVVMELASRGSMENLRRPISWSDFVRMASQLLLGLAHAHARGILHRDIKPANVLLGSTQDLRSHIKLADFGIAHSLVDGAREFSSDPSNEIEEHAVGTPTYMAPEQFGGRWRSYGPATDLYAFGILCWELLCGTPPFVHDDAKELAMMHWRSPLPAFRPEVDVPEGTLVWLQRLLGKRYGDRFPFASQALSALCALDEPHASPGRMRVPDLSDVVSATHLRQDPVMPALALRMVGVRPMANAAREDVMRALAASASDALAQPGVRSLSLRGASGVGVTHVSQRLVESLHEVGLAQSFVLPAHPEAGLAASLRSSLLVAFRAEGLRADRLRARVATTLGEDATRDDTLALSDWLADTMDLDLTLPARWLLRFAAEQPMVLWVDDSGASRDIAPLVRALVDGAADQADARLWILHSSTAGPDSPQGDRPALLPGPHATAMELQPLNDDEVRALLSATLPCSPALLQRLVIEAQGRPGVAIRRIQQLLQEGRLRPIRGTVHWVDALA